MGASGGSFSLSRLRAGLKPFRLHFFPRVGSTSDHAAKLRRAGRLFAPAVVLAGRQIAGRGRGSNTWWSGAGGLAVTFVLAVHDRIPPQEIPLLAGLAVRSAAAEWAGEIGVGLKWPNDLVYQGKKLGGLLCERINSVDLVGVGLNVNVDHAKAPRQLRDMLCSLKEITGQTMDVTDVLLGVAKQLRQIMRRRLEQPFATFAREYAEHDALRGDRVTIISPGDGQPLAGRCEGIDSAGRLMVRSRGTLHHVIAGHVVRQRVGA